MTKDFTYWDASDLLRKMFMSREDKEAVRGFLDDLTQTVMDEAIRAGELEVTIAQLLNENKRLKDENGLFRTALYKPENFDKLY